MTRSDGQAERPLTKAEHQRIQERHHIERVMRQSRSKSLPKWLRANEGRWLGVRWTWMRSSWLPLGAAIVVAGALLGLSIGMVVQNSHLSRRIATLRDESNQLTTRQVESLGRIEQALQQLATTEAALQARLQTIADGQGQLTSKLTAVEAGQASAASRDQLATLEKTTREGLAGVAGNQEALASSVRELLTLLKEQQAPAATPTEPQPASPPSEAAPTP